jgi:DNA repair protein RadC
LKANHITIKTGNGSEKPFEVRETLQQKMAGLQKGDAVILMVDKDNKVIDLAVPPAAR